MNVTELKTKAQEWVHRTDLASQVDTMLELAEARIRNDLILKKIEKSVTGLIDGGVLQYPQDLEQAQRLIVYRAGREFTLRYAAPSEAESLTGRTGFPQAYAALDQAFILYPEPDGEYTYQLYYIPTVSALTSASTTNWLLERSPNVYLTALCREAAVFLQDADMARNYEELYGLALDGLKNASERLRLANSNPMTIRPRNVW